MKIAILIHGQPRFSTPLDNFIDSLPKDAEVDWFFFLWKENLQSLNRIDMAESWISVNEEWALAKIKSNLPEHHKIAAFELGDKDQCVFPKLTGPIGWIYHPEWTWRQLESFYRVDQLRQSYEKQNSKYDMVIRTRTDLAFTTGKPEYEKIKESLEIDPTLLITSNGEPHGSPYAIEDIFFITSSDSMNVFSNAVKNVETYNKNGVQLQAESMYAYHAVTSGLKITPSNFKADTRVGTSLIDGVEVSNFGRWA